MRLLRFSEALDRLHQHKRCHLLLGNGFSIACRHDIFSYDALLDRAEFGSPDALARAVFDVLETRDFEEVMNALRNAAKLVRHVSPENQGLADMLMHTVEDLREVLVHTISDHHPDMPSDIAVNAYAACRRFLSSFDTVYSLNYDLLLYWALMQDEIPPSVPHDDGFRQPDEPDTPYVTWEVEQSDSQNVFYLHGALHLFDAGAELQKYTWSRTGVRLIDQVRQALEQSLYPLLVAEGTSRQKKAKIMHSNYLSRGYRSLPHVTGGLLIFGHSLAENDEHILRLIERGRAAYIVVGIYGDKDSPTNRRIKERALRFAAARRGRVVEFFDAADAHVWG